MPPAAGKHARSQAAFERWVREKRVIWDLRSSGQRKHDGRVIYDDLEMDWLWDAWSAGRRSVRVPRRKE